MGYRVETVLKKPKSNKKIGAGVGIQKALSQWLFSMELLWYDLFFVSLVL